MSVRVVARVRPLLNGELDRDIIVHEASDHPSHKQPAVIRIPSPKHAEDFSFKFSSVYSRSSTQQDIFDNEGNPRSSPKPFAIALLLT